MGMAVGITTSPEEVMHATREDSFGAKRKRIRVVDVPGTAIVPSQRVSCSMRD